MLRRDGGNRGFTLVELILAMAIVGILIVAIVSLSGSVLGFSRRANTINTSLAELNDAAGYLATNIRRALRGTGCQSTTGTSGAKHDPEVTCAAESSIDITYGSSTFTCSTTSASGSCIALLVPVVDRSTVDTQIVGYQMLAYRVVPLSAWQGNPGIAEGWDGEDTPLMLEYRAAIACSGSCAVLPPRPASITASSESLVISDLYLIDEDGDPIAPFSIATDPLTPDKLQSATFRLRVRGTGAGLDSIIPNEETLVVTATSRP